MDLKKLRHNHICWKHFFRKVWCEVIDWYCWELKYTNCMCDYLVCNGVKMRAEVDVRWVSDADSDDVNSVQGKQRQLTGSVHDARHLERVEALHPDCTGAAQVEPRRHLGDRRGRHYRWFVQVATAKKEIRGLFTLFLVCMLSMGVSNSIWEIKEFILVLLLGLFLRQAPMHFMVNRDSLRQ